MMIPEFLLQCFTEDRALIEYAAPYLRVIACCLPFWAVMMAVTSVFQGIGDTKTPMILAAGINILNLILCWTFIFGNLGMPKLGVIGAALSLTISRQWAVLSVLFCCFTSGWVYLIIGATVSA